MSRSDFHPENSSLDATETLEQHILAGFPPDLALDLVLNELVVRAAEATHATAAALALARGDEMVCRAATGNLAPDLGVPLNTRDGLSGACLQTRQPQLSVDTEFDPRIDPAVSRRLGIRSILIVPVFDNNEKNAQFAGVLEVFSTSPAAFSHTDQKLLEGFAEECARLRRAAVAMGQRKPASIAATELSAPTPAPRIGPRVMRPPYEVWSVVVGGMAILATIAVSFLIGSRIGWLEPGWLSPGSSRAQTFSPATSDPCLDAGAPGCAAEERSADGAGTHRANPAAPGKSATRVPTQTTSGPVPPGKDELVVYEKGKVVFRMKPAPAKTDSETAAPKSVAGAPGPGHGDASSIVEASSTQKIARSQSVWLSPTQADARLLSRTEPLYPAEALAAHRAGSVVLEVHVAEDGSVSTVRILSGDPLLAVAATQAVRNWRYQPYRQHERVLQFQTDVTLSFALPN